MDTEIDQNLEQITREYVDFLDDTVGDQSDISCQCLPSFQPPLITHRIPFPWRGVANKWKILIKSLTLERHKYLNEV